MRSRSQSKLYTAAPATCSNKKPLKRTRSGSAILKDADIKFSHKKQSARLRSNIISVRRNETECTFVFVGNLDPTVTEIDLEEIFAPCGEIGSIQIRCSRGRGISVGVPIPAHGRKGPDYQYATVQFKQQGAVVEAVELSGTELKGKKIAVSVSPLDLPESRALGFRSKGQDPPEERTPLARLKGKALAIGRSLARQGTETVDKPESSKKVKKRVVFADR